MTAVKKYIPNASCILVAAICLLLCGRWFKEEQRMRTAWNRDQWMACAFGYSAAKTGVSHEEILKQMNHFWGDPEHPNSKPQPQ